MSLRPEWTVESTRAGRPQVVGYLYNSNIKDAANVWLRVDQLGADGAVTGSYRRRVVGDVLSGGRSVFAVPVADAGARYRVAVETVDWVKECRYPSPTHLTLPSSRGEGSDLPLGRGQGRGEGNGGL
jgi:hypothetical protein